MRLRAQAIDPTVFSNFQTLFEYKKQGKGCHLGFYVVFQFFAELTNPSGRIFIVNARLLPKMNKVRSLDYLWWNNTLRVNFVPLTKQSSCFAYQIGDGDEFSMDRVANHMTQQSWVYFGLGLSILGCFFLIW